MKTNCNLIFSQKNSHKKNNYSSSNLQFTQNISNCNLFINPFSDQTESVALTERKSFGNKASIPMKWEKALYTNKKSEHRQLKQNYESILSQTVKNSSINKNLDQEVNININQQNRENHSQSNLILCGNQESIRYVYYQQDSQFSNEISNHKGIQESIIQNKSQLDNNTVLNGIQDIKQSYDQEIKLLLEERQKLKVEKQNLDKLKQANQKRSNQIQKRIKELNKEKKKIAMKNQIRELYEINQSRLNLNQIDSIKYLDERLIKIQQFKVNSKKRKNRQKIILEKFIINLSKISNQKKQFYQYLNLLFFHQLKFNLKYTKFVQKIQQQIRYNNIKHLKQAFKQINSQAKYSSLRFKKIFLNMTQQDNQSIQYQKLDESQDNNNKKWIVQDNRLSYQNNQKYLRNGNSNEIEYIFRKSYQTPKYNGTVYHQNSYIQKNFNDFKKIVKKQKSSQNFKNLKQFIKLRGQNKPRVSFSKISATTSANKNCNCASHSRKNIQITYLQKK